jgi:hypothetical protein
MKSQHDPLGRLLKAAAQAPPRAILDEAPFRVERAALAEWRDGSRAVFEDWWSFLPIFRGGLAFACGIALVALAFSYADRDHPSDEVAIIDSVMTMSYLP